jgi:Tol biopolymer transport system component
LHRILVFGILTSCEHTEPFRPDEGGNAGPLFPASITRLTYSLGEDVIPAWLPDGSAFVYTAERRDRADHDRCLAFMPDSGGTITRYACKTVAADDSINVFDQAAILGDSIAYVRASTERFLQGIGPDGQDLVVAPLADPNAVRVLQQIPFTTPWGATYDAISNVAWVGRSGQQLAFIGERVTYPRSCSSCKPDTVRTGVGLVIAAVAGATLALTRMPDGDSATSLAVSADGDTIYFTKVNDTRVFRRVLTAGQTDTLLDFVTGVARDVTASGGLLAAVVGGSVPSPTSPDRGGSLMLVSGGGPVQIGDSSVLFRRPALSPSGDRLVVSALTGSPNPDLWLFDFR